LLDIPSLAKVYSWRARPIAKTRNVEKSILIGETIGGVTLVIWKLGLVGAVVWSQNCD